MMQISPGVPRAAKAGASGVQRAAIIEDRLNMLLDVMSDDELAPAENVHELRVSLAEYYQRDEYLLCESMGELVRENLRSIRLNVDALIPGRPQQLDQESEK